MFSKRLLCITITAVMSSALAGCLGPMGTVSHENAIKITKNTGTALTTRKRVTRQPTILSNGITIDGMRKFPYPFKAMLALSSDADHETLRKFNVIHEFINTTGDTPLGKGVGLDFSDSFFMYNGSDLPSSVDFGNTPIDREFTYFKGVTNQIYGGNIMNQYIHDGWIDTLHTYGDFSRVDPTHTLFNRSLAAQAISQLETAGDYLSVWTDHGNKSNIDNFGSKGVGKFFDYQEGSTPNSAGYHTDMTIPYGVKYVWPDVPNKTFGFSSIIYPLKLQDGQQVWGFHRFTGGFNKNGGPVWLWTADDLDQQINWDTLKTIIWSRKYAIVATHLSSNSSEAVLAQNTVDALKTLAYQQKIGNVLVARTSRLLNYNVAQQFLQYHVTADGNRAIIHITAIADPIFGSHVPSLDEVRGITFYTSDPKNTVIEIGDSPVPQDLVQYNPADKVGESVGIKWFPADTTNYAISDPRIS